MAPDGRFCSSRDEAIKYMVKEGLYTDEEIEIMEGGMQKILYSVDGILLEYIFVFIEKNSLISPYFYL